jgi:hypothetical protein
MAIESRPVHQVRGPAVIYQSAFPTHPRREGEHSLRNIDRRVASAVYWRTNISDALLGRQPGPRGALADRLDPRSLRRLALVGGVPRREA